MIARPHVERYFDYAYRWRPNVSCDALQLDRAGLVRTAQRRGGPSRSLVAADERAKIAREPDV